MSFACDVVDAVAVVVCLVDFDVLDVCVDFVVVCCLRLRCLMIWLLLLFGFDFDVFDAVAVVVCVLRLMWLMFLLLLLVFVCCFRCV